ncbi:MAG: response regulator [Chloroflexota bacterium]|nr:response regulator [Chloroflexota bacterium]
MTRPMLRRRAANTPAIIVVGEASPLTDFLYAQLRQQECSIITALLLHEVLRLLARRPIPLVVCDDSTSSMRNFALMSEIKQRSPQTHVVLVVPSGSPDQERRARAAGADSYISSTFALKRLQPLLAAVLS